jgi:hypothetical protein
MRVTALATWVCVLGALFGAAVPARAAIVTDTTTFAAYSVTYDSAVWGPLRFPFESVETLPFGDFGFARFFLDPNLRVSSDGSAGAPEQDVTGQIVFDAKPRYGLYGGNITQSGQWSTAGTGGVSVDGSVFDVTAPGGSFFFTQQQAFTSPLGPTADGMHGFYYIVGERSSFDRFDRLIVNYDLRLRAFAGTGSGVAQLASDVSDPSFLFGQGPYPGNNIVGTFASVYFERFPPAPTPVPEPGAMLLIAAASLAWCAMRPKRRR